MEWIVKENAKAVRGTIIRNEMDKEDFYYKDNFIVFSLIYKVKRIKDNIVFITNENFFIPIFFF